MFVRRSTELHESPVVKEVRVEDFDLSSTLESGQIFRYVRAPGGYLVHHRDRVFRVWQRGNALGFEGADEAAVLEYLGLRHNYGEIMRCLPRQGPLGEAVNLYWGLRILCQDPWECLICFLCSSAKSIAQIKVVVEGLCRAFGKPVSLGRYQGFTFPREGTIDDSERLRSIGLGFRARYVYEVNRMVAGGYLSGLAGRPYQEARALLMDLPGVGEKVADCVLLFSLGYLEAFPVDRWIKRGMQEAYFHGRKVSAGKISEFARRHFGQFAGYAQQYLFHYWRNSSTRLSTQNP
ncbi:MAG: DNA-3-methyladenine glycosylase 2 [Deltaproteobacteria bacterium]|nr:DNA-3-methyladenine glycosylase 2 [Deltaproteobacteria bacterium]